MNRILFAASECVPFIKTGGLADVCGALPKEFDKEYWDVRVVIPNYTCIPEKYRKEFKPKIGHFSDLHFCTFLCFRKNYYLCKTRKLPWENP